MVTVATLARLMPSELSQFIDLSQVADSNETLKGQLQTQQMSRLQASVIKAEKPVDIVLEFFRDAAGKIHIRGRLNLVIEVQCQRCLLPMSAEQHSHVGVVVVSDETAAQSLEGEDEPLLSSSHKLNLVAFIEEEILLSLPIVPLHSKDECGATELVDNNTREVDNPFAVLKDLL